MSLGHGELNVPLSILFLGNSYNLDCWSMQRKDTSVLKRNYNNSFFLTHSACSNIHYPTEAVMTMASSVPCDSPFFWLYPLFESIFFWPCGLHIHLCVYNLWIDVPEAHYPFIFCGHLISAPSSLHAQHKIEVFY